MRTILANLARGRAKRHRDAMRAYRVAAGMARYGARDEVQADWLSEAAKAHERKWIKWELRAERWGK